MSSQQPSMLISYRYDALNRLSSHRQLNIADCERFYCINNLITEIQGDEHISIVQHGALLLAHQKHHGDGLEIDMIVTDQQRSVLYALQTQYPRAVSYSPYGHRNVASGMSSLLGFTGQRLDPVTGNYLLGNGYRAFNPVLMRFNSPDNLSPFGKGGPNAYVYCLGDPINRIDPRGDSSIGVFFSRIAAKLTAASRRDFKAVKSITRIADDVYTFVDTKKNGQRLNFIAHGSRRSGLMYVGDGRKMTASEAIKLAELSGVEVESYSSYRIIMCHSGSFAREFSRHVRGGVKGYDGQVHVMENFGSAYKITTGKTFEGYRNFSVVKDARKLRALGSKNKYSPITFDNALDVRDSSASRPSESY